MPITDALAPYISGPGLSLGIKTGLVDSNGTTTTVPAQNLTLPANAASFIYYDVGGAAIAQNTSGFPANCIPIATATTEANYISAYADVRPDFIAGGGGGAAAGILGDIQLNDGTGVLTTADALDPGALYRLRADGTASLVSTSNLLLSAGTASEAQIVLDQASSTVDIETNSGSDGITIDPSTGVTVKCSSSNIISVQDLGGNVIKVGGPSSGIDGLILQATASGSSFVQVNSQTLGFFTATPIAKPTVTGAKGGNAALTSLITALTNLGLIINSTS